MSVSSSKRLESRPLRFWVENFGSRLALPLALILLIGLTAIISPGFLSPRNLQNILLQAAPLGIVVIGQCLVILVRGLDLSVASVTATAAVIATCFGPTNASAPAVVLSALGMAAAVGLINGLIVTKRGVSPFLVTLASMIVLQGIRFAVTKGVPSGNVPPVFRTVGTGLFLGIPINLIILICLGIVFVILTIRVPLGRQIYIVGNNPKAAKLVGINVDNVTIFCYVMSSLLAGVGGLVLVGYVGVVDNFVGRGYELDSIVAAVMGGVALTGGRGSVVGALTGTIVLVILSNLVLQLGLPVQFQMVLKGVVVILATALYSRRV